MTPSDAAEYMVCLHQALRATYSEETEALRNGAPGCDGAEDLINDDMDGWHFLGAGHFAAVFRPAHSPEWAFKVGFKRRTPGQHMQRGAVAMQVC